jgi:hypothetical protein
LGVTRRWFSGSLLDDQTPNAKGVLARRGKKHSSQRVCVGLISVPMHHLRIDMTTPRPAKSAAKEVLE